MFVKSRLTTSVPSLLAARLDGDQDSVKWSMIHYISVTSFKGTGD